MKLLDFIIHAAASFTATLCFVVMFDVPRWELAFCGLCGTVSWLCYYALSQVFGQTYTISAILFGCVASSFLSRFFSYRRRMPITIYLIGGIIPLVPGTGIYYTMYALMNNDTSYALAKGIETFKVAGVIAIGIMIVLSLPGRIFSLAAGIGRKPGEDTDV